MESEKQLRCPFCDNTEFKRVDKNGAKECTVCHHHIRLNCVRKRIFDADYFLKFMKEKYERGRHA